MYADKSFYVFSDIPHMSRYNPSSDTYTNMDVPIFVIKECDIDKIIDIMARAVDGLSFVEYKDGDTFPRGHEMYTVENVNKLQKFRRERVISDCKRAFAAILKS